VTTVPFASLAASPSPVKCLIVDDLDENLLAFSALLAGDDVEILTARSGVEALDLLLRHEVALAVVDVQMPDMDGFELAELMRGSERTRHVPLIFVTAGLRDRHRVFKGYDSGAVDFLFKPIEPQILQNKAEVFFQLYRQKQQLQRELHERTQTLRLNEMFVAVLSHDLRTPLGAMMTAANLLKFHSTDPLVLEVADRMLSSGRRMLRMIEDMLDLARARLAGGIPLVRTSADIGSIVQRVVQEHQAAVPSRAITIVTQGDLAGDWDVDRLAQVMANVVGNAVQHGVGDSPVRITIDGTGADAIHVLVANEGTIDPAVMPHVFDPFRGGPRLASRQGGLGLGLYIARQIVLAHEGHIAVREEPAGHTTVDVTVPRRGPAATPG
jgi:signal transduction histidine kinase